MSYKKLIDLTPNPTSYASQYYNSKTKEFNSTTEYLWTYDITKLIDKCGLVPIIIEFELKAETEGTVNIYSRDGLDVKYYFSTSVLATTFWKKYKIKIVPKLDSEEKNNTHIAFYGTYGSGVIPSVRNLKINFLISVNEIKGRLNTKNLFNSKKQFEEGTYKKLSLNLIPGDYTLSLEKNLCNSTDTPYGDAWYVCCISDESIENVNSKVWDNAIIKIGNSHATYSNIFKTLYNFTVIENQKVAFYLLGRSIKENLYYDDILYNLFGNIQLEKSSTSTTYIPYIQTFKKVKTLVDVKREGYEFYEYIQNDDGKSYIDTGLKTGDCDTIEHNIQFTTLTVRQLIGQNNQGGYWGIMSNGYYERYVSFGVKAGNKDNIYLTNGNNVYKKGIYINKKSVNLSDLQFDNTSEKFINNTYKLFGLSSNNNGVSYNCKYCKIFMFKAYLNGITVMHLVPCKNPDNEYGMYDLINNKFYGNAGTGSFTVGPVYTHKELRTMFEETNEEIEEANVISEETN